MGLTEKDLARLGPGAQRQIVHKLALEAMCDLPLAASPLTGSHAWAALSPQSGQERTAKETGPTKGPQKAKKYRNQPVTVNGIHFDSKKEASRYMELMTMLGAGKIRDLRLQPQYTLQESYVTTEGVRVRAIKYVADFAYERETEPDANGQTYWLHTVEDVKSKATKTRVYEMKKKLMLDKFGISIREV